jgi:hypothetical protein
MQLSLYVVGIGRFRLHLQLDLLGTIFGLNVGDVRLFTSFSFCSSTLRDSRVAAGSTFITPFRDILSICQVSRYTPPLKSRKV